jgi:hypothetical protein
VSSERSVFYENRSRFSCSHDVIASCYILLKRTIDPPFVGTIARPGANVVCFVNAIWLHRQLLAELMGVDDTAASTMEYTDPSICKAFLCGMCPNELLENTVSTSYEML